MSLRLCINKLMPCRLIYTNIIHINKFYFSTQQKDDKPPTKLQPRKLAISNNPQSSALSDEPPTGYTSQSETHAKIETESETKTESETTENQQKHKSNTDTKTSKLPNEKKYAFDILNTEILEDGKPDINALSDEEQRLYKVVQHLINEGFIDQLELLKLSEKRNEIEKETKQKFNKFEKENKINSIELDESGLNKWRDEIINEMNEESIYYKNIFSKPLLINMKNFMLNRNYFRDPLNELEDDIYYELQLDDRDLKHILIYLIYNHLNTKRFYELNPSIKELANLLYGIKTQTDFNRLLNIMSRTRKQIINIMQSYPKQSTPNILINYDNINELQYDKNLEKDTYKYDEYGQNIEQNERNMTSFELDNTIKRIQDLEFRQYGYTQPQLNKYDETDNEFIKVVQDDDEDEKTNVSENINQSEDNISDDDDDDIDSNDKDKQEGYYNSVMEKVQQRWNGDLMDIKYVGGDWRVRLGIAEREVETNIDIDDEINKQYKRQLNESIAYTTRKRYKISPWNVRSLPYAEATELNVHFTNIKLLNKFVNDRGMILPRRYTGVDKRTQKRIAKAIKRARQMGFMPYMSKLLILDKKQIQKKQENLYIKQFLQNEKDEYDLINITDLQSMYPEYTPNDDQYKQNIIINKNNDNLEIDIDGEYDIDANELIYETQLRKQQNIFIKQIKQDIIKQIPEYWQKRLSFRDKSNVLVNKMYNKNKKNKFTMTKKTQETKLLDTSQ